MRQLLFVCTGNVCRSPFAERYAAHLGRSVATNWAVASAGIGALAGSGMESLMAAELQRRGGDPAGFTARQVTPEIIGAADLIVGMEAVHRSFVLDDFPGRVRHTFTLAQLARAVAAAPADLHGARLLDSVGANRPRVRPEEDIADPYRRGPDAAAAVAARIGGLLEQTIPRLLG